MRVHIYDWVTCSWRYVWRPATVVRAMRHLTFGATIVCSGVTVWPPAPPVEAHPPPPPQQTIVVPPPGAWAPPPSPFGYLPPEPAVGTWAPVGPIPLGPLLQVPLGREETEFTVPAGPTAVAHPYRPPTVAPDCDTPAPPPKNPVPEPATFGIFALGIMALGFVLRRGKPVLPEVKWVVLMNGGAE